MQVVVEIDPLDQRTLQRQVFDQLRDLIVDGKLRAGEAIPASRALCGQLGVSRNTVILAYDQLLAEGYIESRPNVGMFVSPSVPERMMHAPPIGVAMPAPGNAAARPAAGRLPTQQLVSPNRKLTELDFWVGRSAPDGFPARDWLQITEAKLRHASTRLTEYPAPQGLLELREAIVQHLGPSRGITAFADEVVVVGGSQDGLSLLALMCAKPGSMCPRVDCAFVHEDPCYQGAFHLFENHGYTTIAVPVLDDGIDVTALPDRQGALLYVTPSHQYPLGVTLSQSKRHALLDWARDTDSFIIEDDYDGEFRYEGAPLTALRGHDRDGRVIYLGTFSKSLGAGLRLGYMVLPPALVGRARDWKALTSNGTGWIEQAVMAEFMHGGAYNRHLRRVRATYKARRDQLIKSLHGAFGEVSLLGADNGMHLSWRLPDALRPAESLRRTALDAGVGVYTIATGGAHATRHNPHQNEIILLGYAALSEQQIRQAVDQMASALSLPNH